MRIALSSLSGAGTTTAVTEIAPQLGFRVVNYTFRDLARELGVEFQKVQDAASLDTRYDYLTDAQLLRASLADNVVVGSRLAGWLVAADVCIWLHAPLDVRAQRIYKREGGSLQEVSIKTAKRDAQNAERFQSLYGIDVQDHAPFEFTINTTRLGIDDVAKAILAIVNWVQAQSPELAKRRLVSQTKFRQTICRALNIEEGQLLDPAVPFSPRTFLPDLSS